MRKIEIRNFNDGSTIYQDKAESFKALVEAAVRAQANLRWADLHGTNLRWANLHEADLRGADLRGAKNAELIFAQVSIVPETGGFQGWKSCRGGVLVRLHIPAEAKRSSATGRKCRASEALVLEVIGAEVGLSQFLATFEYRKGQVVKPLSPFDENRWNEGGSGIHFFLTRIEAENFTLGNG